ncbi:MAG TPA: hypothetical protein VF503_15520 [Sphingobium sp.]|uniref:hypothetical protein n=1 Tax=Sphingobium sp. TaxID=1912891 RepID=UPI002ED5B5F7
MAGDSRSYTLDISEHLFRLTTESLRLHSNETGRYETLASLVQERLCVADPLDDHHSETIRDHLSVITTNGEIRVTFNVPSSSADILAAANERFAKALGSNITVADTLSILLFHYAVSQKAMVVLKRIGFDDSEERSKPGGDNRKTIENVFTIR